MIKRQLGSGSSYEVDLKTVRDHEVIFLDNKGRRENMSPEEINTKTNFFTLAGIVLFYVVLISGQIALLMEGNRQETKIDSERPAASSRHDQTSSPHLSGEYCTPIPREFQKDCTGHLHFSYVGSKCCK